MRKKIMVVRGKLAVWSKHQPEPIRPIAGKVCHGLKATLISNKPNRKVVEMLREDVAELAQACGRS